MLTKRASAIPGWRRFLVGTSLHMRAIWSGAVTFGLVTIPVKLYTAVGRRDSIDLHLLHEKDGERVHYKRVCEKGHEVDWDDIIKGYEYEKGKWVTFTDEELEALEVDAARVVDVVTFVPLEDIEPIYFEKTYYVAPEESGLKAYRLLAGAMKDEGLIGIAKVAIRQREHLAAITVEEDRLDLHTIHWPDEIREPEFDVLDKRTRIGDAERKMARQLVRQLTDEFRPEEFEDDYHKALEELARKKIKGEEIVVPEAPEEPSGVVDLMEALKQSVEQARKGKKPAPTTERRKSSVSSEAEMQKWTKDELYERAKELGVPGRASMDKKELIEALRKTSAA
jgi:DNA end-binding protein Ku